MTRLVKYFTSRGKSKALKKTQLNFKYRKSNIKGIIYEIELRLRKGKKNKIQERIKEVLRIRRENQPWGLLTAGSTFKNPDRQSAGSLIDKSGLKGLRVGGAKISAKHANFIINTGTATAGDIIKLIKTIKQTVKDKFGVILHPEIHIIEQS